MGKLGLIFLAAAMLAVAPTAWAAESERKAPAWCYYDGDGNAISGEIPFRPKLPYDVCWREVHRNRGEIREQLGAVGRLRNRVNSWHRLYFEPSGAGSVDFADYIDTSRGWMREQLQDPVNPRSWAWMRYPITGGWSVVAMNSRNNTESITVNPSRVVMTAPDLRFRSDPGENTWRRPILGYTWEVIVNSPTACTPTATSPARSRTTPQEPLSVKTAVEAALDDVSSCFP